MSIRAYIAVGILLAIGGLFATQQARITLALRQAQAAMEDADTAKARAALLAAELQFARLSQRVVTQYIDRVTVVHERGQTIIKEVPTYVTPQADAQCPVPAGFVSLHDAAAANAVPDPGAAGDPDAPAPGITLSRVATTVAGNYTACHATREQVIALQAFITGLVAVLREANTQ